MLGPHPVCIYILTQKPLSVVPFVEISSYVRVLVVISIYGWRHGNIVGYINEVTLC